MVVLVKRSNIERESNISDMTLSVRTAGCVLLLLLSPGASAPQVVGVLDEVAVGNSFVPIDAGAPQIIGNGRYVAFLGEQSPEPDGLWLWVKDVTAPRGVIRRFDFRFVANGTLGGWAISPDARYVVFASKDPTLVQHKTNLCWRVDSFSAPRQEPCFDLFLRDMTTGVVTRIHGPEQREVAANVGSLVAFSPDGRWVVYQRTFADTPTANPIQVLLHDLDRGTTSLVSGGLSAHSGRASDGARRVAFVAVLNAGTTSATPAIMVYDRLTGATERVDVDDPAIDGPADNPMISADGRYVAFESFCRSCPAIENPKLHVRDLKWKRTFRPLHGIGRGEPDHGADLSGLGPDGRFVLIESASRNLAADDQGYGDVFVLDRFTNSITRVSRGFEGAQPNGVSFAATMDARSGRVAFRSQADSLAPHPVAPGSIYLYLASLDLDDDRLHDSWEQYFFGTMLTTDPAFDDDADGLTNVQEFEQQSHPRGRYGVTVRVNPESDTWGIKLHNLSRQEATIVLRIVDPRQAAAAKALKLPVNSLTPVRLSDLPDRPREPFLLHIESDEPVLGLTRDWRP